MKLTKIKMQRIKEFAEHSMFRMNAGNVDCYTFSLTNDGEWRGGWERENCLTDESCDCEYVYRFSTGEFVRR